MWKIWRSNLERLLSFNWTDSFSQILNCGVDLNSTLRSILESIKHQHEVTEENTKVLLQVKDELKHIASLLNVSPTLVETPVSVPKPAAETFYVFGNAGTPPDRFADIVVQSESGKLFSVCARGGGDFCFSAEPGKYRITPALSGEYFVPTYREIEVVDQNLYEINFKDPPIINRWLGVQLAKI
jgi:hypothetical protein